MECGAFYHQHGSENDRALGEIERIVEIGSTYRPDRDGCQPCAAIVGFVDLTSDDAAGALERAKHAGSGRLRGIRNIGPHDDEAVLGPVAAAPAGLYSSDAFRRGFAALAKADLSFDAWVFAPQIGEVTALARAFPDVAIMLDHVGTPLGIARHSGRLEADFPDWKRAIRELATCPNVHVKLGGLAMPFTMLEGLGPSRRAGSETLARLWKPYIETCIEAFGPDRSLFESNFPVDHWGADYVEIWNAFKLLTRGASASEKASLFSGSAARFYRLHL
jgi:predicted TIM-barrel fold metal-dependent hydrolase